MRETQDSRTLTASEVETLVSGLSTNGFAIVEDVISSSFLAEIRAELDRLERERPGGDLPPAPFTGLHTRRWFDVLNDGDVWQRVATHPDLLAVLEGALGATFLLSTMGSAVIGPGEAAQPIHCDDSLYLMDRPHKNLVCNTMWALTDFTEKNGATRVVPGSNHFDVYPPRPIVRRTDAGRSDAGRSDAGRSDAAVDGSAVDGDTHETVPVEMPAGSVAFILGTTYHGAGANRSNETRWGLTINYCSGAVRQQENFMLAIPPERLMAFRPELQDLLGFQIYEGGAGHIFAGDPRMEMTRRFDPDPRTVRSKAPRSLTMTPSD